MHEQAGSDFRVHSHNEGMKGDVCLLSNSRRQALVSNLKSVMAYNVNVIFASIFVESVQKSSVFPTMLI